MAVKYRCILRAHGDSSFHRVEFTDGHAAGVYQDVGSKKLEICNATDLNKRRTKELIAILQRYADTGEIKP